MNQTITIEEILEYMESFQASIINGIIDIEQQRNEDYFNHTYKTKNISKEINADFRMAEKMLFES